MLTGAYLLLLTGAFLMLRLSPPSGSFPRPLPASEEQELAERAMNGDLEARNRLIEHNLRLVAHIIKKYYTSAEDADDLISIGTIGLIKGVNTYSPGRGVRLATYASRCIENELLMYFRSLKKSSGDVSLSEALDTDAEGNSLSLIDVLAEDEDLAERVSLSDECRRVRECVECVLPPREAEVMNGAKPLTQRDTAARLGISRSYVSRIEKRALARLREALDG